MDEDRLEVPPLPLSFQPDLVGENWSPSAHGGGGGDKRLNKKSIKPIGSSPAVDKGDEEGQYSNSMSGIELAQPVASDYHEHSNDDDDKPDGSDTSKIRSAPISLQRQVSFSFDSDLSTPDPFHAEFYITSLRNKEEFKQAGIDPQRQPYLRFGRPDVPDTFARVERLCAAEGIGRVAVVCCGPASMMESVQEECRKRGGCCGSSGSGGVSFDLHLEEFDF
jgi:hypothetical protein